MTALAVAIPAIQQAASLIDTTNDKDPERFAQAQSWYAAAIAGDSVALCKLKYMGGLRGCAPGGCSGTAACGFATTVAKAYAEQLYQQALRVLAGQLSPAQPLPPSPAPSGSGQSAGSVLQGVSEVSGAAATGLGYPPQPNATQVLNYVSGFAPLILIVAVGAIVYAIVKTRR